MGALDLAIVGGALLAAALFLCRAALKLLRSFRKGAAPSCASCAPEGSGGRSGAGTPGAGASGGPSRGCPGCSACPGRSACSGG